MLNFILVLNIAIAITVFYLFVKMRKGEAGTESKFLYELIEKRLGDINQISNESKEYLSKQNTQVEEKLGDIKLKLSNLIKEELTQMAASQTKQFSDISDANSHRLDGINKGNLEWQIKLSSDIQKKLELGLNNINDFNTKNFKLLNDTNQQKLNEIQNKVEAKMDEQLKKNLESFDVVKQNLVKMQGSAEKMIDSTKSVDKLNNLFQRAAIANYGAFGEKYLETTLSENLPDGSWDKQVKVPNGSEVIDFTIKYHDKVVGIDSKFPHATYKDYAEAELTQKPMMYKIFLSSVKKMLEDIKNKYGKAGFVDHLMIYFPSESIYATIIDEPKIVELLNKYSITPSSPSTLMPLIVTIKEFYFKSNINEKAEHIVSGLVKISQNVESFQEEFRKLGDKLRQAQTNYDVAGKNLISVQSEVRMLEE